MTRKYTLLPGKEHYFPEGIERHTVAEANQDDRALVRSQITYALYRPSDRIRATLQSILGDFNDDDLKVGVFPQVKPVCCQAEGYWGVADYWKVKSRLEGQVVVMSLAVRGDVRDVLINGITIDTKGGSVRGHNLGLATGRVAHGKDINDLSRWIVTPTKDQKIWRLRRPFDEKGGLYESSFRREEDLDHVGRGY